MDKEKKRKFHLVLYGIAIPVSLFALYTFIFVFDNGIGWKIALIIIGLGWLISAISGFIENLKNEYYGAAEPPVRCGESHLSGLTEPPIDSYSA